MHISHTAMVICCAAWAFSSMVASVHQGLQRRRQLSNRRFSYWPRRPSTGIGRRHLITQLILTAFLGLTFHKGWWDAPSIGVSNTVPGAISMVGGFTLYVVAIQIYTMLLRAAGRMSTLEDASFGALRLTWPRARSEKYLAFVGACLLNPITEELICRGVLVYMLGELLGSHLISILFGAATFFTIHLYQGGMALVGHLFIFPLIIGLLYSPLGLLGCIGFHFAADFIPVLTFRRQMIRWRNQHRSRCQISQTPAAQQ